MQPAAPGARGIRGGETPRRGSSAAKCWRNPNGGRLAVGVGAVVRPDAGSWGKAPGRGVHGGAKAPCPKGGCKAGRRSHSPLAKACGRPLGSAPSGLTTHALFQRAIISMGGSKRLRIVQRVVLCRQRNGELRFAELCNRNDGLHRSNDAAKTAAVSPARFARRTWTTRAQRGSGPPAASPALWIRARLPPGPAHTYNAGTGNPT